MGKYEDLKKKGGLNEGLISGDDKEVKKKKEGGFFSSLFKRDKSPTTTESDNPDYYRKMNDGPK